MPLQQLAPAPRSLLSLPLALTNTRKPGGWSSRGRTRPHSRVPSTAQQIHMAGPPGGSLPAGLSHSCVHTQGKVRHQVRCRLKRPQRTRCRPGAENDRIQVPGRANWADSPSQLTVSVLSLVPSSGPFALVPAASRVVPSGRAGEGGAAAGPQAGHPPQQLRCGPVPTVLPEKAPI